VRVKKRKRTVERGAREVISEMFRVHHVLILLREVSDGFVSRRTYVVKHYRKQKKWLKN
jgi:hypothetical protein